MQIGISPVSAGTQGELIEPCYALEVTGRGRWQVQRGACHHTLIREKEQRPLVVALFQTKAGYTHADAYNKWKGKQYAEETRSGAGQKAVE